MVGLTEGVEFRGVGQSRWTGTCGRRCPCSQGRGVRSAPGPCTGNKMTVSTGSGPVSV